MTSDEKLQAFEVLMSEISTAIADMATAIEEGRAPVEEIGSALADIVEMLESKSPADQIAQAIKGIRIESVVNVSPTPITITPTVQVLSRPSNYKMTVKYDLQNRITEALVSRIETKE